jgi:hypothetical protein
MEASLHVILSPARAAVALVILGAALLATPPLRASAASGSPIDGIRCDQMEGAVFHIHQHLTILDHGKPITIPSDIGRPLAASCLYWLHTHTDDGIIHVESPVFRTFTLGQVFDIWGQPLSSTNAAGIKVAKGQLRVYVNGELVKGDPRKVELAQHSDIAIEAGGPFHKPEAFTDWKGQ